MKDQAAEAAIAAVAQKASVGGGSVALIGGLTANDLMAFVGAAVAVLGLAVQIYFKRKDDRRKDEIHRMRLSGARFQDDGDDA
jgi:hypothetical protein